MLRLTPVIIAGAMALAGMVVAAQDPSSPLEPPTTLSPKPKSSATAGPDAATGASQETRSSAPPPTPGQATVELPPARVTSPHLTPLLPTDPTLPPISALPHADALPGAEKANAILTIVSLQQIRAVDAESLLAKLIDGVQVAAEPRTNALILRGPLERIQEVTALLERIDQPAPTPPAGTFVPQPTVPAPSAEAEQPGVLRERYLAADQRARRLAEELPTGAGRKATDALREAVREAFRLRQQLQQAELRELAERWDSIRRTVSAREKLEKEIVERRVAELIDPALRWESAPAAAGTKTLPAANAPPVTLAAPAEMPFVNVTPSPGGVAGTPSILRSADEFQKLLVERSDKLAESELALSKHPKSDDPTRATLQEFAERNFRTAQRELKMIRDEYAAQLQLLQLEQARAEAELQTAQQQLERTEQLVQRGVVSTIESSRAKQKFAEARNQLDRIRVLLELYAKAGEEVSAPQTPATSGNRRF
ncbi:MAG: secretin N-terminal domain-containing protein [Pirellulaceae bacterium]